MKRRVVIFTLFLVLGIGRRRDKRSGIGFACFSIGLLFLLFATNAHSVPSFARQTGQDCIMCHTVFPELTPFGRAFKLGGYVMSRSSKSYEFPPPLAGMVQLSFSRTKKDQPSDSIEENWATHSHSSDNNIISSPQEASIFYGGRIFDKIGGFVQGTFDGAAKETFLDNTDIRYANSLTVLDKNLTFGFTINNNPTVQDVWNSTPAWGFPFASSNVVPTPAAGTIIEGTLAQQVGGIGAYAFWNNLLYLEGAVYRTTKNGITEPLGAGTNTDTIVHGAAPYWRLALQHLWGNHSLSAGTYGIWAEIFPEGMDDGPTDRFTDSAFDAQYQYIGSKHLLSARTSWVHEKQDWKASFPLGNTANESDFLNAFNINLSYFYKTQISRIGGSLGYFSTTGRRDDFLYSPDPVDGSRTGSPNSNGFVLGADYILNYPLWKKYNTGMIKCSMQYMIYNKFNGAHSDYDGFGRDASDNNTLYFLLWLTF
jgi:hypothetical protein